MRQPDADSAAVTVLCGVCVAVALALACVWRAVGSLAEGREWRKQELYAVGPVYACLSRRLASVTRHGRGYCGTGLSAATCPRVKTNMESWDWSPLSGVQVQFTNTTATDGNSEWTVSFVSVISCSRHICSSSPLHTPLTPWSLSHPTLFHTFI